MLYIERGRRLTMSAKPDLEKPDLSGWKRIAERHWRKFRPKFVAYLTKEGLLEEHLQEAAQRGEEMYSQLLRKRVPEHMATELAEHEYILLPDIDEDLEPQPDETTE